MVNYCVCLWSSEDGKLLFVSGDSEDGKLLFVSVEL